MTMKIAKIELVPGTEVIVPRDDYAELYTTAMSYREILERCNGERHVFRFVDLGGGPGLFAAFAACRWPYAFIDAYEDREEPAKLLRMNAQPMTRFYDAIPKTLPKCDAIHVGSHITTVILDAVRSLEIKVAVWDFDSDERFENVAGFNRALGLKLSHVAIVKQGPPTKGWQLWIRDEDMPAFTTVSRGNVA